MLRFPMLNTLLGSRIALQVKHRWTIEILRV